MTIERIATAGWGSCTAGPALHLLGGPYITFGYGQTLHDVPESSKRLLAYVALLRRRVDRRQAAGTLWPIGDESRAAGNLRSALWRLKCAGVPLLTVDRCSLTLRHEVVVDVHVLCEWAERLITGTARHADLAPQPALSAAMELLPGWYDDWVLMERERIRQRLLHGLEAQSRALVRAGRIAEAVDIALHAVGFEPLRESAQRVLIEAHLAEGNRGEARRALATYHQLLVDEVGAEPSPDLGSLLTVHHTSADPRRDRFLRADHSRARRT